MDKVSTTNRCYFDVNEYSVAAYWSFLLYNIVDWPTFNSLSA